MDANRNALWRNPERLPADRIVRMNRFWGDTTWRDIAFKEEETLFETRTTKAVSDDFVAEAYRKRLKEKAGFAHVPKPIPMRNSRGGTIYYLFFASQKPVAKEIVTHIFNKYRSKGVRI
jgi:three-Cys-motif partner protein